MMGVSDETGDIVNDGPMTTLIPDAASWIYTYERVADLISDVLTEMGFRPQVADHDARLILARLMESGFTVETAR